MKLIAIISLFFFASCKSWEKLPATKLNEMCNRKLLVYEVKDYKGGHIIKVRGGIHYSTWYFTFNKPDSVKVGSYINNILLLKSLK